MKIKKLLLALTVAIVVAACSKKSDPTPTPIPDPPVTPPVVKPYVPDQSFKIVAYMPSYRDPSLVDISKYSMITHLFYAFLVISPAGDGSLNAHSATETSWLNINKQRAKANNVKFGIAISGLSQYFVTMAASASARSKFVTNVVNFAKANSLEGVDLDWEYPSAVNSSADDFVLLVKELSEALHKEGMFFSAAVTPAVYAGNIKEGIKPAAFQYLDFVNIMQYDGSGYDTAEPLNHASYKMTVKSMDVYLIDKGLPREKAILGMPLYGRNAGGAKAIGYREIESSGADVNLNLATVNNEAYGYNGIALIKQKTQLAKDRGNGIMFWEFAQDSNTANSLIKAANDQLGRAY